MSWRKRAKATLPSPNHKKTNGGFHASLSLLGGDMRRTAMLKALDIGLKVLALTAGATLLAIGLIVS
jgi:hypothetical protein